MYREQGTLKMLERRKMTKQRALPDILQYFRGTRKAIDN